MVRRVNGGSPGHSRYLRQVDKSQTVLRVWLPWVESGETLKASELGDKISR